MISIKNDTFIRLEMDSIHCIWYKLRMHTCILSESCRCAQCSATHPCCSFLFSSFSEFLYCTKTYLRVYIWALHTVIGENCTKMNLTSVHLIYTFCVFFFPFFVSYIYNCSQSHLPKTISTTPDLLRRPQHWNVCCWRVKQSFCCEAQNSSLRG